MEYTTQDLKNIWSKARTAPGYKPDAVRMDSCGALMQFNLYGEQSEYGWEVDHINPLSNGGQTVLNNLQPLQWENNRSKGDKLNGNWTCAVGA